MGLAGTTGRRVDGNEAGPKACASVTLPCLYACFDNPACAPVPFAAHSFPPISPCPDWGAVGRSDRSQVTRGAGRAARYDRERGSGRDEWGE
jgi:hypothetical protein